MVYKDLIISTIVDDIRRNAIIAEVYKDLIISTIVDGHAHVMGTTTSIRT